MLDKISNPTPLSWQDSIQTSLSNWIGRPIQVLCNAMYSYSLQFQESVKTNAYSAIAFTKNLTTGPESKKIIFCADGTWNTPKEKTNVYKIFKAILQTPNQVVFYDDGVGTNGVPLQKLTGAALGAGIFEKVKTGYSKIAQVYKPGDEIFIFGFSRGAFTARSLAGMISLCGLPTSGFDDKLVNDAFDAYRFPLQRESILKNLNAYKLCLPPIKMVGVWDTVAALGASAISGQVGPLFSFLDPTLHPNIQNAYHALAIDEWRREFAPTLWNKPATPVPGQTLEQVWFSGSHGNIGGGYLKSKVSDLCLHWMMKKAENLGLQMDPAVVDQYPLDIKHAVDKLDSSWNAFWLWPNFRKIADDSTLSNTVAMRAENSKSYRPKNLIWENGGLSNSYQIQKIVESPISST